LALVFLPLAVAALRFALGAFLADLTCVLLVLADDFFAIMMLLLDTPARK
jgi:hypothetical protein